MKKRSIKTITFSLFCLFMPLSLFAADLPIVDAEKKVIDEDELYEKAYYLVLEEKYSEAEELFVSSIYKSGKRDFENKENSLLYARVLSKNKKYNAALKIYITFDFDTLEAKDKMNIVKLYYNVQDYKNAINLLNNFYSTKNEENQNHEEIEYMKGLCYLNTSDYKNAYSAFNSYVFQNKESSQYYELASFYKAYATYKDANYKESVKLFSSFAEKTVEVSLARQAYELAAKSAILINDYNLAAEFCEKLIQISFKENDVQNAVLFCAQIYTECKNYEQAHKVLSSYINDKSDFALTCLFTKAQIYEKQGNIKEAENIYNTIQKRFENDVRVEDAVYKNAELFYTKNDYNAAAKRFSSYIKQYPRGKYIEAATYFCGECYLRTKEYELCIMNSKNIVTKYPSSVYMYGANKNLFLAYYETEDYSNALKVANELIQKYNSQAVQDGIVYEVEVLKSITKGNKKNIAQKMAEVEKNGGLETKEGRLSSFELYNLYLEDGEQIKALALAKNLSNKANSNDCDEALVLGHVTHFIADSEEDEKKPAMYIKAAEYFRLSGQDSQNAPAVLYKAVDAFLVLNMKSDARETANVLKKLYPTSRQAKNVDALF